MYIFFGDEIANKLKDNYLILELEKFVYDDQEVRAYCVIPSDKISLAELPNIPKYKLLHSELINKLDNKDNEFCLTAIPVLLGKFGGELDSFYTEIQQRLS